DALAQRGGMIPDLPVNAPSPSPVFRKVERGVSFGEGILSQKKEIQEILLRYRFGDCEQRIDLRSHTPVLSDGPHRRVVKCAQTNGDTVNASVEGSQFAFSLVRCDDGQKSRRRRSERPQLLRIREDRRQVVPRRNVVVLKQTRQKSEGFISGIRRDNERTIAI